MGDSPRSEAFPSRFSTPVNELDDHRGQPESLPRADTLHSHGRRGTARSTTGPPPILLVDDEALRQGMTSRDFENAIIDDDRSEGYSPHAETSPNQNSLGARRDTFRRPPTNEDRPNRSRASSRSRRSPSPVGSVHAFAGPRQRGRAGTAETYASQAPSFLATLQRTASGETHRKSRAFSEDKTKNPETSDNSSVEDDVCFPPEETAKPYAIDFEDLEEFVTRERSDSPVPQPIRRKQSFSCRSHNAMQNAELKPAKTVPGKGPPSPLRKSSVVIPGDSHSDVDEKLASLLDEKQDSNRRNTFTIEPVNRWSFFSSELEDSIHAPDLGDLLMPGETFKELFTLGPEGGCWWLDMLMPTEEEVEVVCKAFGIHGLTREDIIEQETREKVELFKSYYFVCFRSFYQMDKTSEMYMEPVNVYAVVFREGVLTFTFSPSPHAANVRKRMGRLRDYVALGADWICYALIDDIVDTFAPVIQSVEDETETIEDGVFTARAEDSRQILRQIGECRKTVMSLIRLLGGKADVIKGFAKRCNEQYSIAPRQDVGMYLSDIQDHVVTMMSNLSHFEKMLSRSHSNYLAQISVDNISQGNKANEILTKVTFIATILVPLNLVCGLFGMNVKVPGGGGDSLAWWFGILGGIIAFVIASTVIAKRMRLI